MRQKWLTVLCTAALLSAFLPPAARAAGTETVPVLVGLVYGSDALDGANLKNDAGSGYRFGYLDTDRNFCPVGETRETGVSVVKTQTVWYGTYNGYTSYSDAVTSDVCVG